MSDTAVAPPVKKPTTLVGSLYQSAIESDVGKRVAPFVPLEIRAGAQTLATTNAFTEAFLTTATANISGDYSTKLHAQFSAMGAPLLFQVGITGGIAAGVAIDLWKNIEGLYEIAKLAVEFSPIGLAAKGIENVAEYLHDPALYKQIRTAEAAHAFAVAKAIEAVGLKILTDPMFLVTSGEEFGAACGAMAATWFNDDFMQQSVTRKGFTIGTFLGMAFTEVALLFLGPEEWVAKGLMVAGRVTKGSRMWIAMTRFLEKVPEVARLLKGRAELAESLKVAKQMEQTAKAARDAKVGEKALAGAGDVAKGGGSPPTIELPKQAELAPKKPAKVDAPQTKQPAKVDSPPAKKPAKVDAPPKVEPAKTEPVKVETPTATEPVKAEPVKTEPVKTEPVKTEPVKTEPPKPDPTVDQAPAKPKPKRGTPEGQKDVVARKGESAQGAAERAEQSRGRLIDAQTAKAEADRAVIEASETLEKARQKAKTAAEAAAGTKRGSPASMANTAARNEVTQAEAALKRAEGAQGRAQTKLTNAEKSAEYWGTQVGNRADELKRSEGYLKQVEYWAAHPEEAPRISPSDPFFEPTKRRPNLSDFKDVKPTKVDRHSGMRIDPDARVGVFKEKVPEELRLEHERIMKILDDPNATQAERAAAGHDYERLIGKDLVKRGETPRITHNAGDKGRVGDVGIHEVTVEQAISDGKLDQLWRDLLARESAIITVPRLDPNSAERLSHMAAIFEKLTGKRPLITVRETAL